MSFTLESVRFHLEELGFKDLPEATLLNFLESVNAAVAAAPLEELYASDTPSVAPSHAALHTDNIREAPTTTSAAASSFSVTHSPAKQPVSNAPRAVDPDLPEPPIQHFSEAQLDEMQHSKPLFSPIMPAYRSQPLPHSEPPMPHTQFSRQQPQFSSPGNAPYRSEELRAWEEQRGGNITPTKLHFGAPTVRDVEETQAARIRRLEQIYDEFVSGNSARGVSSHAHAHAHMNEMPLDFSSPPPVSRPESASVTPRTTSRPNSARRYSMARSPSSPLIMSPWRCGAGSAELDLLQYGFKRGKAATPGVRPSSASARSPAQSSGAARTPPHSARSTRSSSSKSRSASRKHAGAPVAAKRFDPVTRFHQFASAWETDPFLARLAKSRPSGGRNTSFASPSRP